MKPAVSMKFPAEVIPVLATFCFSKSLEAAQILKVSFWFVELSYMEDPSFRHFLHMHFLVVQRLYEG